MKPASNTTILVIEDDDAVRQTLTDILDLNGFRTVVANNGTDGLIAARRETPSVIITDVSMPGLTGFELLEDFRADPALRALPVIIVSAKADRAAIRRGMELGAADFITKPFTEDEVIRSVATRLEKKELLDELDAFARTVAHDLKNPLCTLKGRLDLLAMMLGKADEATLRHQLAEASTSASRLSGIIDELLILAGVRRERVRSLPLDMPALTAEAIQQVEHLIQRQGASIQVPDTWPAAVGHGPWIVQVWVNYISNAAKYGGPEPRIVLGGDTRDGGRYARFWVQDSGPGLDAAALEKVFVPFNQITAVRANGHGLGLSIVHRIVERLEGRVGVESAIGHGARFWFELPTAARPKAEIPLFAP